MKIAVFGTGYVGLTSAACFAEMGYQVMGVDRDADKIDKLKRGEAPFYEPGLEELVERHVKSGRLKFSTDAAEGISFADVVFSAVGTPPDKDGRADLSAVEEVARTFGKNADTYKIFVNKSTVPVGTGEKCHAIIAEAGAKDFDVVSNPEFLRQGAAVKDTLNPDRVIVGAESSRAAEIMERIYSPVSRAGRPIIKTDIKTAEVIKYAANSFLATKISFINEMANFCEKTGADVSMVSKGIGSDPRIGNKFLQAGIGYGGSCFGKDVQALIQSGKSEAFDFRILQAVEDVNNRQKERIFEKLHSHMPNLEGKTIAVWGLAFKPRTDDMRDAPSIRIIKRLQAEGAKIRAYDPVAMESAKKRFAEVNLEYCASSMEAAKGADALLLLTEWDEFRTVDFTELKATMAGDYLFDGRNIYDPAEARGAGFYYEGMGRESTPKKQ